MVLGEPTCELPSSFPLTSDPHKGVLELEAGASPFLVGTSAERGRRGSREGLGVVGVSWFVHVIRGLGHLASGRNGDGETEVYHAGENTRSHIHSIDLCLGPSTFV